MTPADDGACTHSPEVVTSGLQAPVRRVVLGAIGSDLRSNLAILYECQHAATTAVETATRPRDEAAHSAVPDLVDAFLGARVELPLRLGQRGTRQTRT